MIGARPPGALSEGDAVGANTWPDVRRVIKGGDFIATVVQLASENLSTAVRRACAERLRTRAELTYERTHQASKVAGPLHAWMTSH